MTTIGLQGIVGFSLVHVIDTETGALWAVPFSGSFEVGSAVLRERDGAIMIGSLDSDGVLLQAAVGESRLLTTYLDWEDRNNSVLDITVDESDISILGGSAEVIAVDRQTGTQGQSTQVDPESLDHTDSIGREPIPGQHFDAVEALDGAGNFSISPDQSRIAWINEDANLEVLDFLTGETDFVYVGFVPGEDSLSRVDLQWIDNWNVAVFPGSTAVLHQIPIFAEEPVAAHLCAGLNVTVDLSRGQRPTNGDDVIRGTAGVDVIDARGGNDTICSLQGDDEIVGGDGNDKIFAGLGNDTVHGGAGNDLLVGGAGGDTLHGETGNDRIQGGDDGDTLHGDGGLDVIRGGNGHDTITGGTHDDRIWGNLGRDSLFGGDGNDVLRGGAWLDSMNGGAGNNDGCTLTDPGGLDEVRSQCETGVFGR